jgi:ribonuclease P protein component
MLPKRNRLKRKKDFQKVLGKGKGLKEDFLVFKMVRNDLPFSRFGFLVGTKISKEAVSRNKLKRRIRELVRKRIEKIEGGYDMVFIAQPGLEKRDFWELEEILNKVFLKAKLIK